LSDFTFEIKNNLLIFKTTSFKAEKGSILHSAIYNRELASSLASGAFIMLLGFFFVSRFNITIIHLFLGLVLFALSFIFFRTFIFKEPKLILIINKEKKHLNINLKAIINKRIEIPFSELISVKQGYFKVAPDNIDGIRLVERVALQHGTVIPGFGKTVELFTVEIEFGKGKRITLFSSENLLEVKEIISKILDFIKE
jgi:hypothetical protein